MSADNNLETDIGDQHANCAEGLDGTADKPKANSSIDASAHGPPLASPIRLELPENVDERQAKTKPRARGSASELPIPRNARSQTSLVSAESNYSIGLGDNLGTTASNE